MIKIISLMFTITAFNAFGTDPESDCDSTLASVGAGVRIYSTRSSHQGVVHIDIIKPLVSAETVDSWEWRLQLKEYF